MKIMSITLTLTSVKGIDSKRYEESLRKIRPLCSLERWPETLGKELMSR